MIHLHARELNPDPTALFRSGWSPWNAHFLEECNVVIMNLGLHYKPTGNHTGKETRRPLFDDMRAAITYLSNFTASADNRVAVWRSALPQHFSTKDGHFPGPGKLGWNHTCSNIERAYVSKEQVYNEAYDEAFFALGCRPAFIESTGHPCDRFRTRCTVNPMADVEYQTIYNFWRRNNCTDDIDRERSRLGNSSAATPGGRGKNVTGIIHRWRIFDLFDIPTVHSKDGDCTHVCYAPQLWEATFERLFLLLEPSLTSF